MSNNLNVRVEQAEVLQAINRSEIDIQIATAKQYPRNLDKSINQIKAIATRNEKIANECFYWLKKDGQEIEGLSVRLAEIIANSWGNVRIQTRIVGNDGKTITAQGICHDLETNVAVSVEVKRRITNRYGQTYSEDMQVVTGNAASAIAFRNAVLKVIPRAITEEVVQGIKNVAIGKAKDLTTNRKEMFKYYENTLGISKEMILDFLKINKVSEINEDELFKLRGLANAFKEGTASIEEVFPMVRRKTDEIAKRAVERAQEAKKRAEEAMKMNKNNNE